MNGYVMHKLKSEKYNIFVGVIKIINKINKNNFKETKVTSVLIRLFNIES